MIEIAKRKKGRLDTQTLQKESLNTMNIKDTQRKIRSGSGSVVTRRHMTPTEGTQE
jgi:hypothetical protein